MKIQAAPIESVSGDLGLHRGSGRRAVNANAIGAFAMPVRGDTEGYRPIGRVLVDGSIFLISHLIAVVLELLPKWAEFRPSFVTRGARHAVLPRKGRDRAHPRCWDRQGGRGAAIYQKETKDNRSADEKR